MFSFPGEGASCSPRKCSSLPPLPGRMSNWYSGNLLVAEELGPLQKLLWTLTGDKCGSDMTSSAFSLRLEITAYLITISNLWLVLITKMEISATAQAAIWNLSCPVLAMMVKNSSLPSDLSRAPLNPGFLNQDTRGSTDIAPRDLSSENCINFVFLFCILICILKKR